MDSAVFGIKIYIKVDPKISGLISIKNFPQNAFHTIW